MTPTHGPVVGRRRLRSVLRRAREAAGLTQEQVAVAMDWSLSKLIRIEAGTVSISTNDAKALLNLYRLTDPAQVAELVELARVSRRRTWWSQYRDTVPAAYLSYVGLEAEASALQVFQSSGIPGLLQTDTYARAMVAAAASTISLDPLNEAEAEKRHAIRMQRQRDVLSRPQPPEMEVVLDEAVLHRQTGGPACIREQLLHLVAMGEAPNIDIRVLPFAAGSYAPQPPFIVLRFSDPGDIEVVYREGVLADELVDRPEAVAPYRRTFRRLQEMSLSTAESRSLIEKVAGEIGSPATSR